MKRTKSSFNADGFYRLMLRLRHFGFGPRLLAVVLIAATAAYAAWDLWEKASGMLQVAPRAAKQGVKKPVRIETTAAGIGQDAQSAGQIIVARNLFATTDVLSGAPGNGGYSTENMAQTALQMELLGTVSGGGSYNCAVINDPEQKKPRAFKVGDQVRGATISKILRRSVVLMVDGREEVLNMKSPSAGRRNGYVPPRSAVQEASPGSAGDSFKDMMNLTNARPHFESGKMDGYYIGNVEEGSYFKRIGLQGGDIVEGINDQAFTKPDDINQLQNLNRAPGVKNTLRIKRQGRPMTLKLD